MLGKSFLRSNCACLLAVLTRTVESTTSTGAARLSKKAFRFSPNSLKNLLEHREQIPCVMMGSEGASDRTASKFVPHHAQIFLIFDFFSSGSATVLEAGNQNAVPCEGAQSIIWLICFLPRAPIHDSNFPEYAVTKIVSYSHDSRRGLRSRGSVLDCGGSTFPLPTSIAAAIADWSGPPSLSS